MIYFEVAPVRTGYKAILGKPAYVKPMARPSYAYLQLKMPGPNGMITLAGSPHRNGDHPAKLVVHERHEIGHHAVHERVSCQVVQAADGNFHGSSSGQATR